MSSQNIRGWKKSCQKPRNTRVQMVKSSIITLSRDTARSVVENPTLSADHGGAVTENMILQI